ncbi:PREDICTED: uncharacterized protein LOC108383156 [Rhagoletis zephyria]|uniref:uncharacterized protein LOC108383156 n=1 Tax=Rhagoletis zephyria TaxID=28612 RepID=UPI0008117C53|nr:PREDICTED: uncharacterized protein LOC108383156 [Rhagoletis zephyria]
MHSVLIQEPGMEDDISDDGNPPPSLPPPALNVGTSKEGNSLNLGMAQIIVTAATPMVEDGTDKSFPPVGESDGGSAAEAAATAKTASGGNDKAVKQKKVEPKPVAPAAAADENENHEDDTHSSDQDPDSEVKTLQEAEDPFNEKGSGDAGDGFEANFEAHFDANFDDAFSGGAQSADINAELSADDVQTPKQVVGGRASIPEELDSNQLARLQNLKESNA